MSVKTPALDDRNFDDIVNQALTLAKYYCQDWKIKEDETGRQTNDPGKALIYLFARLMEIIITRLNQVPEKNLLAFLDFIGAKLRPPAPARALMQFALSRGTKKNTRVPAGTQVSTEESGDKEEEVFETVEELVVTPVKLVKAFSLEPGTNQCDDRTPIVIGAQDGFFDIFEAGNPVEHILYLGDDRLFGLKETSALVFTFTDKNRGFQDLSLDWEYSRGEGSWQPLKIDQQELLGNPLTVTFKNPNDMAKDIVSGHEHYWIRIKFTEDITGIAQLPEIESVTGSVDITSSGVLPDACFCNQLPIDPPDNFYPFGLAPTNQHFFYMASDQVFSRTGAAISIAVRFDLPGKKGSTENLGLSWEYWDGDNWLPINISKDPTNHFTQDPGQNKIEFVCPRIEPKEINLQTRYWIRVRISSGHYGLQAHYDSNKKKWVDGNLNPPEIGNIKLGYTFQPGTDNVETIILKNNFKFSQPEPGSSAFLPFVPLEEQDPSFYMGFDTSFSNDSQSLFFQVKENLGSSRRLQWEYSGTDSWKRLNVMDDTRSLSTPGHVRFIGPEDFSQAEKFGLNRYWLRIRLTHISGLEEPSPKLQRIYLNTVWAENVETIKDELLGSSDGSTNQNFQLNRYPVLPGQQVRVVEREMPGKDELEKIIREEGRNAVEVEKDEKGSIIEIRVRWHEVNNFYASGPNSRHYVIEPATGKISFGDGNRGMVPPIGNNNIRCSLYQTGGGVPGNVDRGKIIQLKSAVPYIDNVTNVLAAEGGTDAQTLDEIKERGPFMLKHRDRAVTAEDFQWLMQEAPGNIAQWKCIPATDWSCSGQVILIIVPDMDDPGPYPGETLIRSVENYLYERGLASLANTHPSPVQVRGPGYIKISVQADIIPQNIQQAGKVEENVITNLETFFHPLKGGTQKQGWPFGRDVHTPEVMEVIQNTAGVDFVKELRLIAPVQIYKITLKKPVPLYFPPESTVSSGDGQIKYLLAEEIEETQNIIVKGFKQGDRVKITRMIELTVISASRDQLIFEAFQVEWDMPPGSMVSTLDGKVQSFTLKTIRKEPVQNNTKFRSILIKEIKGKGFKPGDRIRVTHEGDLGNMKEFSIISVSGNELTLYLDTSQAIHKGSTVSTLDETVRSVTLEEIPGGTGDLSIKIREIAEYDTVIIHSRDNKLYSKELVVEEVDGKNPARVYLEPDYLVYSGEHSINMVLERI